MEVAPVASAPKSVRDGMRRPGKSSWRILMGLWVGKESGYNAVVNENPSVVWWIIGAVAVALFFCVISPRDAYLRVRRFWIEPPPDVLGSIAKGIGYAVLVVLGNLAFFGVISYASWGVDHHPRWVNWVGLGLSFVALYFLHRTPKSSR